MVGYDRGDAVGPEQLDERGTRKAGVADLGDVAQSGIFSNGRWGRQPPWGGA